MRRRLLLATTLAGFFMTSLSAVATVYPGKKPGKSVAKESLGKFTLKNGLLQATFEQKDNSLLFKSMVNSESGGELKVEKPPFTVTLDSGEVLVPSKMSREGKIAFLKKRNGVVLKASWLHPATQSRFVWNAILKHGTNYLRQEITISAENDLKVKSVQLIDFEKLTDMRVHGNVNGSPVTINDKKIFAGFEHPMVKNEVDGDRLSAKWSTPFTVKAGNTQSFSAVLGIYPEKSQLRRAFLHYLENERPRPYKPYLHYNTWFDLNISNGKNNRMESAEAENSIRMIGDELVAKRGVNMDGFVLDDGWDYHDDQNKWDKKRKPWDFHNGFPNGFKEVKELSFDKYKAGVGVWLSPFGGYGHECGRRVRAGRDFFNFETRGGLLSPSGKVYGKHFYDTCFELMDKFKVNYFKFDRMGGNDSSGNISGGAAADILAVLKLSQDLHKRDRDVFVNATVGTWPSPFWTLYADSIWRQGQDAGALGRGDSPMSNGADVKCAGNGRERWISYRDDLMHDRIKQRGPLYPLNSIMFHGVTIGERSLGNIHPRGNSAEARQSVRNEVRMAFGGGSQLQELYITPKLLVKQNWDDIAEAAKWNHANLDVLVDTHWIGGDPSALEVYGFASWTPKKAAVTLRNPKNMKQEFVLNVREHFEVPSRFKGKYRLLSPYKDQRVQELKVTTADKIKLTLEPFEVLVFSGKRIR